MILEKKDVAARGAAPAVVLETSRPSRTLRALQAATSVVARHTGSSSDAGRPAVDLQELTRRFRGRREVIRKILSLFDGECERLVGELRDFIDHADLVAATAAAHRLKGSADTASARGIAEAARRIEEGCRRGRPEEVIAGFADLEREAPRATEQIAAELARDAASPAEIEVIERT